LNRQDARAAKKIKNRTNERHATKKRDIFHYHELLVAPGGSSGFLFGAFSFVMVVFGSLGVSAVKKGIRRWG
jgi:hypothetical protein